jgi:hypothetical protein
MSIIDEIYTKQQIEARKGDRTATLQTPPFRIGARVYRNSAQSINNTALTAVSFSHARYNHGNDGVMWLIGAPTRITCMTAGVYLFTGHVSFAANAVGDRRVYIRLGGATYLAGQESMAITTAASGTRLSVTTMYELAVTNYIELIVYQSSTAALNLESSANLSPELAAWRVA